MARCADLDREERQAIETTFRDPGSGLKVLVATTTVAMGVNTPAWSVVIAGLDPPDSPYSVAEYKNMAGRAGRLGFTDRGKSFLVAATPAEEYYLWHTYVRGTPESLVSRFADQEPPSLVCRVLATAAAAKTDGLSAQELVDFIQSTFAAHQGGRKFHGEAVFRAAQQLFEAGLAELVEDRYRLTALGRVAGELGIYVESVVRIARALRGLPGREMMDRVLLAAAQLSQELDEVLFPVHAKSVKERQRWQGALHAQRLPGSVVRAVSATDDKTFTARCKRLAAVLMWLEGVELNAEREREVVELLDGVVAEVNAQFPQPVITTGETARGREYRFGNRTLTLHFFRQGALYDNPLVPGRMETLRKRHAEHGGYIEIKENGEDREGWNLVLVRRDDGPGEWRIVETRVSALTGRRRGSSRSRQRPSFLPTTSPATGPRRCTRSA